MNIFCELDRYMISLYLRRLRLPLRELKSYSS